jgi:hypothetical protein
MTPGTTIGPIRIAKAAFFSTCHASARDELDGREREFTPPAYGLLVGRARRFTSLVTQMHVEVCGALQPDAQRAPAVFATCHGEIQTCERLITDFRDTSMVSSARFALSVHNTASGMYSVATGSTAPTTTITGANAIAAGWLEASLIALDADRPVLLSIADEPVPAVFGAPSQPVGFAAAFLVGAGADLDQGPDGCAAQLVVTACPGDPVPVIDSLHALARAADACARGAPVAVALGPIQPGAMLELRIGRPPPAEARA